MSQSIEHIRACYDAVACAYAEKFANELAHKPMDQEMLSRFAALVKDRGDVLDLGCGPGQTTAFLHSQGIKVRGLDLSDGLVREAQQRHPHIGFDQGDMLALPVSDDSLAGVVAFYAIVHFSPNQLECALREIYRVLKTGGRLLLAFHIGDRPVHVDEFLGRPVSLDFVFFKPRDVIDDLTRAGFVSVESIEREPYPEVEYQSRRAYIFACKP